MSEANQIVITVKKQLKKQGMTYRDVAQALELSEPSVKRLFASGRFTIERLVQICNLLGYTVAELSREALSESHRLSTLTERQERELISDHKLLLIAVCALNHWAPDEIVALYKLSMPECIKYLLKLDKLHIINLLPGNRIRINVARDFDWLPFGPIRQYFKQKGIGEFLHSDFIDSDESMTFLHGMFTDHALVQIQDELRKLRLKFAELHEASLSAPMNKRHGHGFLLAMRSWEPVEFAKLRR